MSNITLELHVHTHVTYIHVHHTHTQQYLEKKKNHSQLEAVPRDVNLD